MIDQSASRIVRVDVRAALDVLAACDMQSALNDLRNGLSSDEVCLAGTDGRVPVGIVVGRPGSVAIEDERVVTYAVLEVLAVIPAARSREIGTRLIEAFENEALQAGASTLHLDVAPAQRQQLAPFYRAQGFSESQPGHWVRKLSPPQGGR